MTLSNFGEAADPDAVPERQTRKARLRYVVDPDRSADWLDFFEKLHFDRGPLLFNL